MSKHARVSYWDNLRFVLILLVVIGHFIADSVDSSQIFRGMWAMIYCFHMPLFIYVSGYFHKNTRIAEKVVAYVSICLVMKVFLRSILMAFGEDSEFLLFSDSSYTWFMFALAVFVLITYLLRDMDLRLILVISVMIGLFSGYDKTLGDFLIASRLVVFYPFYLLGVMTPRDLTDRCRRKLPLRLLALIILGIWVFLCITRADDFYSLKGLFTGRNHFNGQLRPYGFLWRTLHYLLASLLGFSLILVIPDLHLPVITDTGKRTLQIYFWHRPILIICYHAGLTPLLCSSDSGKMIGFACSVLMTFLLSLNLFSFPTDTILKYAVKRPQGNTADNFSVRKPMDSSGSALRCSPENPEEPDSPDPEFSAGSSRRHRTYGNHSSRS